MDFTEAAETARRVRAMYTTLEERHHGTEWSPTEMVVGMQQDVGDLGRLVMAAEGRWTHGDDPKAALEYELAEVMWWLFSIADRLDIDMEAAFTTSMSTLGERLAAATSSPAVEPASD
jgi:NTP pyrophosphatase (non-canonical NTP hydrolase)